MNPSSSSTSSSEAAATNEAERATWQGIAQTVAWSLAWIVVFDLVAGMVFRMPSDVTIEPNRMQAYFDYGRSVEAKLRTMVTPDDATSHPLVHAGWLKSVESHDGPTVASGPGKILIAAYGQSFTHRTLEHAIRKDPRIEMRLIAGPGAPLSHCVKAAEIDRNAHQAQVVLVGVLASTLQYLAMMSPMAWGFEAPAPFTFPRYRVEGGRLLETAPPFIDLAGLRHALNDRVAYAKFRTALAESASFDPFIFDHDLLDYSVLGRLVRRSFGHAHQTAYTNRYHSPAGFINRDGLVDVARALMVEHVRRVRADGRIPLVILFEDRGYDGHLEAVLKETLQEHNVPFVSSRSVAPASDLRNFLPDGHFKPEGDALIADALLRELDAALPPKPQN